MDNIKLYEIDPAYIDYLSPHAPHLFHNAKTTQNNKRKYIGVVLTINDYQYFAPLSSFKEKHKTMKESIDFLKVKTYCVINLNNMLPVPFNLCNYININNEKNPKYKELLLAEYRYIKSIQDKIRKNAKAVYTIKLKNDNSTLANRCNDFKLLEKLCSEYENRIIPNHSIIGSLN